MNFNPAFREPEWQSLHAAALAVLTDALHDAAEAHEEEDDDADSAESIWQVAPSPNDARPPQQYAEEPLS